MTPSDQELLGQIRKGNQAAFKALVEKYKSYTFTVALRIVHSREDAEEIAQDVFIKIYHMLHTFQGSSSFKTWLYAITYRTAIDYTRRNQKHLHDSLDPGMSLADPAQVPTTQQDHLKMVLSKLIASLKPADAALITFFYLDDLSIKEISEITGLGINNIKTRLFRLRDQLRNTLENDYKLQLNDLL